MQLRIIDNGGALLRRTAEGGCPHMFRRFQPSKLPAPAFPFLHSRFDVIFVASFMDILNQLFEQHFHAPAEQVQPLQGQLGGSGRKIIRLRAGTSSAIGILYDVREENVAFLEFSRHFRRHGLPVPEIYGEDLSQGAYLEEDLGSTTLFEFLSTASQRGEHLP